MDFLNGQTLLNLCEKEQISISAAMKSLWELFRPQR